MSHPYVQESFSYWATNPNDTAANDLDSLREASKTYPYCQILHFIVAQNTASFHGELAAESIQTAAAYALSRNALRKAVQHEFEWSEHLNFGINDIQPYNSPDQLPTSKFTLPDLSSITFDLDKLAKAPLPDSPPLDDTALRESNLQEELAQLNTAKRIEEKLEEDRQLQLDIIDNFIDNEALMGPIRVNLHDKAEPEDLIKKRSAGISTDNVVSEGMAKLMLRQGKIEKAVEIYEQLILKKPEKKAYFVEKIKDLTNE
jgi:tetratricopeptide (TPR) repeat protein